MDVDGDFAGETTFIVDGGEPEREMEVDEDDEMAEHVEMSEETKDDHVVEDEEEEDEDQEVEVVEIPDEREEEMEEREEIMEEREEMPEEREEMVEEREEETEDREKQMDVENDESAAFQSRSARFATPGQPSSTRVLRSASRRSPREEAASPPLRLAATMLPQGRFVCTPVERQTGGKLREQNGEKEKPKILNNIASCKSFIRQMTPKKVDAKARHAQLKAAVLNREKLAEERQRQHEERKQQELEEKKQKREERQRLALKRKAEMEEERAAKLRKKQNTQTTTTAKKAPAAETANAKRLEQQRRLQQEAKQRLEEGQKQRQARERVLRMTGSSAPSLPVSTAIAPAPIRAPVLGSSKMSVKCTPPHPVASSKTLFKSTTPRRILGPPVTSSVGGGAASAVMSPPPIPHMPTPPGPNAARYESYDNNATAETATTNAVRYENYDINNLTENDSTDDEDSPRRPIPQWARNGPIKAACWNQDKFGPRGEDIFPPTDIDTPNLMRIFSNKPRARYHEHRGSSACWNSPMVKQLRMN